MANIVLTHNLSLKISLSEIVVILLKVSNFLLLSFEFSNFGRLVDKPIYVGVSFLSSIVLYYFLFFRIRYNFDEKNLKIFIFVLDAYIVYGIWRSGLNILVGFFIVAFILLILIYDHTDTGTIFSTEVSSYQKNRNN